jgi:hypothetical protein
MVRYLDIRFSLKSIIWKLDLSGLTMSTVAGHCRIQLVKMSALLAGARMDGWMDFVTVNAPLPS